MCTGIFAAAMCRDFRSGYVGYKAIIMPLRGPNWLSQVWHRPEQLGWGQSVAKRAKKNYLLTYLLNVY